MKNKVVCTSKDLTPRSNKSLFYDIRDRLKVVPEDSDEGVPVQVIMYIRTDTTNKVVAGEEGFTFVSDVDYVSKAYNHSGLSNPYPLFLLDVISMFGRDVFTTVFVLEDKEIFRQLVLGSTCYPVGAMCDGSRFYIIANIVESAQVLESCGDVLDDKFFFTSIEGLKEAYFKVRKPEDKSYLGFILDSLVITKGDELCE